jgi:hypothetical protein
MPVMGARERVMGELARWEGAVMRPHRFGGTEWVLGKREIGHIHGDALVDVPFPKAVRDEIVAAGGAEAHHILPESGWVSLWLRRSEDVERGVALPRKSYDLAVLQRDRYAERILS